MLAFKRKWFEQLSGRLKLRLSRREKFYAENYELSQQPEVQIVVNMAKNDIFLSQFDGNRENNFTLIRIFLAWLVLYGHAYALHNPDGIRDPLLQIFQGSIWIGAVAVHGFFAISGYLVCASFVKRGLLDYLLSRILRIYPALVICVFSTVFLLGPAVTTLTTSEYFNSTKTYTYLYNALALEHMQWVLPGVFEDNRRVGVNGSLWSLTAETRCYVILAFLGAFGAFQSRVFANVVIVALVAFGYFFYSDIPLVGERTNWIGALTFFVTGVFVYNNRESIPLNLKTAVMAGCVCYFSFGNPWFDYVFPIAFTYVLFYLSYMTPFLAVDEKLGDISYGLYIYAFPTQQVVALLWPEIGVYGNIVVASVITISLAYISWRFIEKPALSLKNKILGGRGLIQKIG